MVYAVAVGDTVDVITDVEMVTEVVVLLRVEVT